MKKIITLFSLFACTHINAAIIQNNETLSPAFNPYTLRADYDYLLGSLFIFESITLTENTTLNSIEYFVLSGTGTSSYNNTYINIYDSAPDTGNLIIDQTSYANATPYSNTVFISKSDGSIGRPYRHILENLDITLASGQYYLGLSIDDNTSSYLGATSGGSVVMDIEGQTTVIPLPASIWLLIAGLVPIISIKKLKN